MDKLVLLDKAKANLLIKLLNKEYPDTKYYLDFKTPADLLVAAILSAQTRDEVVNNITPKLFSHYKNANDYANSTKEELLDYIKQVSFAGNKASNIIEACKEIVSKYNGKVPNKIEDLLKLKGIGRKTANTILINAYGIVEGIPVDTWVIKLSFRMGLSLNKNPDKIEEDLIGKIEKKYWHNIAYVLKAHGKKICKTIPMCSTCHVKNICPKNGVTEFV
ncbi:endonuclease III [Candidatus Marsarchaeota archaeon]|jgi:endonuclease-3|nr:endonuclease III [Candidatus Marsarchaeota archaeon]MCL5090278.1 endonuclease III [Candidatus Marsarchaeota archaeon]